MGEQTHFDTAIVGSGPCGLFTALALMESGYRGTVAIFEQGKLRSISDLEKPDQTEKGWGGAGAAADGKLNMTLGQGGQLQTIVGEDFLHSQLAPVVTQRYQDFGGKLDRVIVSQGPNAGRIIREAQSLGISLYPSNIVHFGTDDCESIIGNLYHHLRDGNSIFLKRRIESVVRTEDRFLLATNAGEITAVNVVLGCGREGNSWQAQQCESMGIPITMNGADLGIRYETRNETLEELAREFWEAKMIYRASNGLSVRSFCMTPGGFVINDNGKPNGHSFKHRSSGNTNLALLVTLTNVGNPDSYLRQWISRPESEYNQPITLERYGDFRGSVENPTLPSNNPVEPTLKKWTAIGDLNRTLPPEVCIAVRETIERIAGLAPGFNSDHNLCYGNEGKHYALKIPIQLDSRFKIPGLVTSVPGLYVGGDGSGWTRGLFQSSAMGWLIGSYIARRAA